MARAQRVDVGGVEIPVLSAEDLVVTKTLAGRAKDRDDVEGILRERADRLDLEQIRSTLPARAGARSERSAAGVRE